MGCDIANDVLVSYCDLQLLHVVAVMDFLILVNKYIFGFRSDDDDVPRLILIHADTLLEELHVLGNEFVPLLKLQGNKGTFFIRK